MLMEDLETINAPSDAEFWEAVVVGTVIGAAAAFVLAGC
jgi:hypothetical protein